MWLFSSNSIQWCMFRPAACFKVSASCLATGTHKLFHLVWTPLNKQTGFTVNWHFLKGCVGLQVWEHSKLDFVWSILPAHVAPVCDLSLLTNAPVRTGQIPGVRVKKSAGIGLSLLATKEPSGHKVSPDFGKKCERFSTCLHGSLDVKFWWFIYTQHYHFARAGLIAFPIPSTVRVTRPLPEVTFQLNEEWKCYCCFFSCIVTAHLLYSSS